MSEAQVNRRESKRKPFGRRALAKVGSGQTVLCTVTNISRSGARLRVPLVDLPRAFQLVFSDNGRIARECEVTWHRGTDYGVRFMERCTIGLTE